jgi:hypothetical protein
MIDIVDGGSVYESRVTQQNIPLIKLEEKVETIYNLLQEANFWMLQGKILPKYHTLIS